LGVEVSAAERFLALNASELRLELEELYAAYTACLDEERFEEWPDYFVEQCVYKIVPRDNFERGLPLATWLCESRGYLADRVVAIRKTAVYAPRWIRRMVSGIRILGWKDGVLEVRANYLAVETLQDELTRVFNAGQYRDKLVVEDGRLKFKEKLCIFDSILVPNSLIYPL
jgi:3-phenylpropionate/cinnamic acid dioxygenase small subunit